MENYDWALDEPIEIDEEGERAYAEFCAAEAEREAVTEQDAIRLAEMEALRECGDSELPF